jgi:hypothetical protein
VYARYVRYRTDGGRPGSYKGQKKWRPVRHGAPAAKRPPDIAEAHRGAFGYGSTRYEHQIQHVRQVKSDMGWDCSYLAALQSTLQILRTMVFTVSVLLLRSCAVSCR